MRFQGGRRSERDGGGRRKKWRRLERNGEGLRKTKEEVSEGRRSERDGGGLRKNGRLERDGEGQRGAEENWKMEEACKDGGGLEGTENA